MLQRKQPYILDSLMLTKEELLAKTKEFLVLCLASKVIKTKKSIDADGVDPKDIPPFTPLIPEQWLQRCQEFKTLHIVKYQRIFQSLIYLLKFHP
jgi:hypothetical protein